MNNGQYINLSINVKVFAIGTFGLPLVTTTLVLECKRNY